MKSIRKVSGRLFLGLSMVLLNTGALSYAQTNTFPNDGNVGIGTVSPNVSGQPGTVLSISSGSANGFLELIGNRTTNANVGGIDFINNAASNTRIATILGSRVDQDNSGELQFYTNAAGAGLVQRMVISKSGSLGVGTTNPTYRLSTLLAMTCYCKETAISPGSDYKQRLENGPSITTVPSPIFFRSTM